MVNRSSGDAMTATTALVVATRTAVDRCSAGHGVPPLLPGGLQQRRFKGQKTVTSAGGMGPAPLSEVARPQGTAVGHVAACVLSVATLFLAAPAAQEIDYSSLVREALL